MTQEFCGGIIPICPVCDRGVNNTCDEQAVKVTEVWYHRPCSRFAQSETALSVADRIMSAIELSPLINPLFQAAALASYKRLRAK